jgi:hypothetical protein
VPCKDSETDRSRATGLAVKKDCDDALFEIDLHDKSLAVVHLTCNRGRELDTRLPRTKLFTDWEERVREAMLPDHEDYAWAHGTHSSHQ